METSKTLLLRRKLNEEIAKSKLLSDEEKAFWLEHCDQLPLHTLENVVNSIEKSNTQIENYIQAALEQDPQQNILMDLKQEILKAKRQAFSIEEASQTVDAEKVLEQKLKEQ